MACADLTEEDKLTFLVAELHVGPMALGKQDQVFIVCSQVCIFKLSQLLCLKCWVFLRHGQRVLCLCGWWASGYMCVGAVWQKKHKSVVFTT